MQANVRVLIVDDSEDDAELIVCSLREAGYSAVSTRVDTAEKFRAELRDSAWDVIICDFSMPSFTAFDALTILHGSTLDVPFIIVSGAIGEDTAVRAMKAGAHDYVLKDNLARLVPAIERELREAEQRRQRRKAVSDLRRTLSLLTATLEATVDGLLAVSSEGEVIVYNERFRTMWDLPHEQPARQRLVDLAELISSQVQSGPAFLKKLAEVSALPEVESADEITTFKGHVFEVFSLPQRVGETTVGRVWSFRDVTERRRTADALAHQALHDSLTQLPNRMLLRDRLEHALRAAKRGDGSTGLLLMDLDRFKDVNDTFGHHWGDRLLEQVARRLSGVLRESDTVARLGGDEFAVVLPGSDLTGATAAAQKILRAIGDPFHVEGHVLSVDGSIGIAMCPEHGADAETLLRRADIAMYAAKRTHSGFAAYASEQDQHSAARLALLGELRTAIDQSQFSVYYQPKVDLRARRVDRLEALIRWVHPANGVISPDRFIPLAEQTGLIGRLDAWVLSQALRECQPVAELAQRRVAVNLSAQNLHDPNLPSIVRRALEETRVEPGGLTLEITESAVMLNPELALQVATKLRDLGVGLAIDDFGTGYSSLAYLTRLPVDELKIDKSFVKDMRENDNDRAIVRATIDLAHTLGLRVVAEGVEDASTLDLLSEFGCDLAQGYYFTEPRPMPVMARWVEQFHHAPSSIG